MVATILVFFIIPYNVIVLLYFIRLGREGKRGTTTCSVGVGQGWMLGLGDNYQVQIPR